jgi:hypothetical protein
VLEGDGSSGQLGEMDLRSLMEHDVSSKCFYGQMFAALGKYV